VLRPELPAPRLAIDFIRNRVEKNGNLSNTRRSPGVTILGDMAAIAALYQLIAATATDQAHEHGSTPRSERACHPVFVISISHKMREEQHPEFVHSPSNIRGAAGAPSEQTYDNGVSLARA
jgi:hypothetical protein